jgi:hypothetical protein
LRQKFYFLRFPPTPLLGKKKKKKRINLVHYSEEMIDIGSIFVFVGLFLILLLRMEAFFQGVYEKLGEHPDDDQDEESEEKDETLDDQEPEQEQDTKETNETMNDKQFPTFDMWESLNTRIANIILPRLQDEMEFWMKKGRNRYQCSFTDNISGDAWLVVVCRGAECHFLYTNCGLKLEMKGNPLNLDNRRRMEYAAISEVVELLEDVGNQAMKRAKTLLVKPDSGEVSTETTSDFQLVQ